jgi:O-antigen ligase
MPQVLQRPLSRAAVWWWVAVVVAGLGVAGTQSRESIVGVLAAAALIWFLRRSGRTSEQPGRTMGRTVLIAAGVVALLFAGNLVVRPSNLHELTRRVAGVFGAIETPAGTENCEGYATNAACIAAGKVQKREVRMVFYQEGARLLAHRPILGYGVGQFGGIVAEENDPNWNLDPRFPGGFNLYDTDGTTVDSFWLHLVVEVGILGLLVYLAWLWLLIVPLLGVTRRYVGRRVWGAGGSRDPVDPRARALALWGVGTMLFSVIVGFLAPDFEDPLFPPLAFGILGLGWVFTRFPTRAAGPADNVSPVSADQ